jgi:CheY-like chemotaxis protein
VPVPGMDDGAPLRILIADDDRDIADSLVLLLQTRGHEVLAVYGGSEAVDAAPSFKPDMVLLDINMPGMNGYKVAAALRRGDPGDMHLVLIANTARTEGEHLQLARQAGFDFHMDKPMDGEKLCAYVEAIRPRATVRH